MRRRVIGLFCVGVVVFGLLLLPLRFVVGLIGGGQFFAIRSVEGTIWHGRLNDLSIDGVTLGDFSAAVRPLSLLSGAAKVRLGSITGEPASATLVASPRHYGAEAVNLRLVLPGAFDPLPIDAIELKEASVLFSSQGCESAQGTVRVMLAGNLGGITLGQQLLGTPRCDGNILSIAMVSQSAMERITLRIAPDGQYNATLAIRASDAAMAAKLNAAGLRETASGHIVDISGRL